MDIRNFATGIQHVGIPTNDINETVSFYQSLGFTLAFSANNQGEEVRFLQLGNLMVEAYQNGQAVLTTGAIDHIAIDVENIDELFLKIKSAGYTMLDQQVNGLPFWERGVKFFTILGPNKEKIEFCQKL